jgi:hypothetical protein
VFVGQQKRLQKSGLSISFLKTLAGLVPVVSRTKNLAQPGASSRPESRRFFGDTAKLQ